VWLLSTYYTVQNTNIKCLAVNIYATWYDTGMCGRYTLTNPQKLSDRFAAQNELDALRASWNVAPSQTMPVVTRNSPNRLELMKWGLVPAWSKEPKTKFSTINARVETLSEKPMFRNLVRNRRCIVPASGFYEWKREGEKKTPYYFYLKDTDIFGFAGLYDIWSDGNGGELRTYTVITVPANEVMEPVHDRMPAILSKEAEGYWLDPAFQVPFDLTAMLSPYPANLMQAYPVSDDVNSPRNNVPVLIEPREEQPAGGGGQNSK
jgi:putative SOS response-associated peptidase YedK